MPDHGMIDAHQYSASSSNCIKKSSTKGIYTSPFHRGLCKQNLNSEIAASKLTYLPQLAHFCILCGCSTYSTVYEIHMRRCNFPTTVCVKSHACTSSHTAMLGCNKHSAYKIFRLTLCWSLFPSILFSQLPHMSISPSTVVLGI